MGRARRRRDLARCPARPGNRRCRARPPWPGGGGHRHDQPARDGRGVGSQQRPAAAPGARLAGPPYRSTVRRTERRRLPANGAGAHGSGARPLLLRHQVRVAPRRGWRRAERPAHPRNRRLLGALEPHRRSARRPPRHGRVQRQPHPPVRHRRAALVRRALRALRHSDLRPGRGPSLCGPLRVHRRRRRRRSPARRAREWDRGRPGGCAVRPGVCAHGHDQEHLRHGQLRPHERR